MQRSALACSFGKLSAMINSWSQFLISSEKFSPPTCQLRGKLGIRESSLGVFNNYDIGGVAFLFGSRLSVWKVISSFWILMVNQRTVSTYFQLNILRAKLEQRTHSHSRQVIVQSRKKLILCFIFFNKFPG